MTLAAITHFLSSVGCEFPDIDLLQPADPFLDTTGEDLRRRIFITQENSGSTFCLRPEFTVPVCLKHLQAGNGPSLYAYGGTVFRQRADAPTEFTQAGFEDLGNNDRPGADINCIKTALEMLAHCKVEKPELIIGNQSIFMTLLDALDIPSAWCKKLGRGFGDDDLLQSHISQMAQGNAGLESAYPAAVATALAADDESQLTDAVTDMMLADGLPLSGGRTASAIAARILEKAELSATQLPVEKQKLLSAFLALELPLDEAADAINALAKQYELDLGSASEEIASLADGLAGSSATMRFRASFGRRLDYYTGLVFELYRAGLTKPVVGGGRYDQLMTLLGAENEVPAVGFAVWVDRLGESA